MTVETTNKKSRREATEHSISKLGKPDGLITEFDERLWHNLLDYTTVYSTDDMPLFESTLSLIAMNLTPFSRNFSKP